MEQTVVSITEKEKRRQYRREWYAKNKEKVKAANQRYWQKKLAALAEPSEESNDSRKN